MIRFENIEVTFGDFTAIPNLDLQVEPGEFFTLLGPSGCGKTTALRTLAGFIEPSAGEVYVDGKASPGSRATSARSAWCSRTMRFFPA